MDVRAFMERFFAEAINKQDVSRLDEFCAPDYKWHGAENSEALGEAMGFPEYVRVCKSFFDAYPGLRRWHRTVGLSRKDPVETRTLAGRRLGQFVKVAGCDPATGYRLETLTPDTKEKSDACNHSADRG